MDKKEPMHRKHGTKNNILYKAGNTDPFVTWSGSWCLWTGDVDPFLTPGLAHDVCDAIFFCWKKDGGQWSRKNHAGKWNFQVSLQFWHSSL